MHKYDMWKPNTDNQTLLRGVPKIDGLQKKYSVQSDILRKNCGVEKIMIEIFEEI